MGVRMPALATGEKIAKVQAQNASRNFAAFEAAVLRSVAGALGITAEQLTGDYSGVNYSTLRGALNESGASSPPISTCSRCTLRRRFSPAGLKKRLSWATCCCPRAQ